MTPATPVRHSYDTRSGDFDWRRSADIKNTNPPVPRASHPVTIIIIIDYRIIVLGGGGGTVRLVLAVQRRHNNNNPNHNNRNYIIEGAVNSNRENARGQPAAALFIPPPPPRPAHCRPTGITFAGKITTSRVAGNNRQRCPSATDNNIIL